MALQGRNSADHCIGLNNAVGGRQNDKLPRCGRNQLMTCVFNPQLCDSITGLNGGSVRDESFLDNAFRHHICRPQVSADDNIGHLTLPLSAGTYCSSCIPARHE
jgi:hypothetical protein